MGKFLPFVFSLRGIYCLYTDIELYAAVIQTVLLCSESEQKAHLSEEKNYFDARSNKFLTPSFDPEFVRMSNAHK